MKKDLEQYLNKTIVIDSNSSWIYVGMLEKVTHDCVVLSNVDVHDNDDTPTSKERYVLECKKTGIKSNRHAVNVKMEHIVSFSLLEDIKEF